MLETTVKFAGSTMTGGLVKLFAEKTTSDTPFTPVNPPPLIVTAVPPAEGRTSVLSDVTSWIGA